MTASTRCPTEVRARNRPLRAAGRPALARALVVGAAALIAAATVPGAAVAGGSDAPAISRRPAVDTSNTFAFTSPDRPDTVTLIGTSWPMQEPSGGSAFYPFAAGARYDFNVDQDGDGRPELIYRYVFSTQSVAGGQSFLYANGQVTSLDDQNLLQRQTYNLTQIVIGPDGRQRRTNLVKGAPVAPSDTGPASMPDYRTLADQAITRLSAGGSSYAGAAADPSFADQRLYDLIYGSNLSEVGQNTYRGYNTNAIALQLPKSALALGGDDSRNPVIGVWTSIAVRGRQASRVGNPLVNDIISSYATKDAFNAARPDGDGQLIGDRVANPEFPQLIQSIYGVPAPATPRNDLTELYLTGICQACGDPAPIQDDLNAQRLNADVPSGRAQPADELRLNMSVPVTAAPDRLGLVGGDRQGFPNGRRLTDDVTDITIQAMEGALATGRMSAPLAGGDEVDAPDRAPSTTFPYLALPYDTNAAGSSRVAASARQVDIVTSAATEHTPGREPVLLGVIAVLAAVLVQRPVGRLARRVRRRV